MTEQWIPICCGTPLINTMIFSKAEHFCRNCKATYGMMDVSHEELTDRLSKEYEENKKWFYNIARDYIAYRCKKSNCKKCKETGWEETHYEHATEEEKLKSTEAYKLLMKD